VILAAHAFVSIFGWYSRLAVAASPNHAARTEAQRLRTEVGTALVALRDASELTELGRRLTTHLGATYVADCNRMDSLT
jgi:HEXXH motif-containing protein